MSKTKINLTPTPGFVMIKPEESLDKTKSGIYLPENATAEKPLKGKVLAVGGDETLPNGVTRKSPTKVNDTVFYKKWGGNEVKINDEELLFAKFEDILAIENG